MLRSIIRPTENCVSAPQSVTRNAASPTSGSSVAFPASRSCISFGSNKVKALNTRPDDIAISISTTTARRTRWRGIGGKGRRLTCVLAGASGRAHPRQPGGSAEQPRGNEGSAPSDRVGQEGGHDRRQCDAQIAEHAVYADRAARFVARGLHQHRRADRVVDRGEPAGAGERHGQHRRRMGEAGSDQTAASAQEEGGHQRLATEPLHQPALRQRQQAVKHEHAGGERQDRAVQLAERAAGNGHRQHGGGQDQQAVVGDRVGGVDEYDLPGGRGHGGFLYFPRNIGCRYGDVWPNSVA